MARLDFGTDGVRGHANDELTVEDAVVVGRAVVSVLGARRLLVGRDTRRSGAMLAAAVCAGAASEGCDVLDLGVLPTPGVAARAAQEGEVGLVVSASHNPFDDNGIKVFAEGGLKLDETLELAIERRCAELAGGPSKRPTGRGVGDVHQDLDAASCYLASLAAQVDGPVLAGLRVVVDCANGAASGLAPALLSDLGAKVRAIGDAPDGCNINDGVGSTSPEALRDAVRADGADLGVALDGDADRCIAVDRTGKVLDGDWLLALFAFERRRLGLPGGVVVTVMSNLGLHHALRDAGIPVEEVPVGDRNVLEALRRTGWALGGEQSGHLVFPDRATTGDGLLTAVLLAELVAARGPLDVLAQGLLTIVPQTLVNVEVADASALDDATGVWATVSEMQRSLGDRGRVVVRASGTEPCVRVMVEAEDEAELARVVDAVTASVRAALGAPKPPG